MAGHPQKSWDMQVSKSYALQENEVETFGIYIQPRI